MKHFQLPSRGRCRYLWTLDDYQGIAENFESNTPYRKLFVTGARKLDLESIYLESRRIHTSLNLSEAEFLNLP